jgi:hypothetical protein
MPHNCPLPNGCHVCTCPDCGAVGLPFVCGSPADPSNGEDCRARARAQQAKP